MSKNILTRASDEFWFTRGKRIIEDAADAHTLSNTAFEAGARWSMRETTRMSPYVNMFIEMLILLGVLDSVLEETPNARHLETESSGTTSDTSVADDDSEMRPMHENVSVSADASWRSPHLL